MNNTAELNEDHKETAKWWKQEEEWLHAIEKDIHISNGTQLIKNTIVLKKIIVRNLKEESNWWPKMA